MDYLHPFLKLKTGISRGINRTTFIVIYLAYFALSALVFISPQFSHLDDSVKAIAVIFLIPIYLVAAILRLFNIGSSPWWAAIGLIPFISFVLDLVLMLMQGKDETTIYSQ